MEVLRIFNTHSGMTITQGCSAFKYYLSNDYAKAKQKQNGCRHEIKMIPCNYDNSTEKGDLYANR